MTTRTNRRPARTNRRRVIRAAARRRLAIMRIYAKAGVTA